MTDSPQVAAQTVHASAQEADRPVKPALWKGWRRRCPNCGEGAMFEGYLKVRDTCTHCGEDLSPQKADDGPAYLTMLVVGHLMAPILHVVAFEWRPAPWVIATVFSIGCVALSLYLLPRIKGGIVAYQWAKRMNGFDARVQAAKKAAQEDIE